MNELSLFSGAGGGLLATKHFLGWRTIGYVEIEDYCQRVIRQRIEDGYLDDAPIFGDIKAFNREGYAERYRGMVDVVTGGFPCQDISCAGTGKGLDGDRSGLWFEMAETVRLVRPRYVFVENSPALLVRGFDRVSGSLSEMGYDCKWGIVSAADAGAPHLRKRIWVAANPSSDMENPDEIRCGKWGQGRPANASARGAKSKRQVQVADVVDADIVEQPGRRNDNRRNGRPELGTNSEYTVKMANADEQQPDRWSLRTGWWAREPLEALQDARQGRGEKAWLSIPESVLGRVADGVAHRVDRLKAIGNGQVPAVVKLAWEILSQ